MSKLTAKEVISAVCRSWAGNHSVFKEAYLGSAWQGAKRVDVAALEHTWAPTCVKIAEVKVSRADFLGDRKWTGYKNYCNEFYWACPTGLISRGEVGDAAGLIMVNPNSRKATVVKKAIYRDVSGDTRFALLYYLMTWRSNPDGGSSRDQRMDRIRREMEENAELGGRYSRFVSGALEEADRTARTAKAAVKIAEQKAEYAEQKMQQTEDRCREANELAGVILECRPDMDAEKFAAMLRAQPYNMVSSMKHVRRGLTQLIRSLGEEVDEESDSP